MKLKVFLPAVMVFAVACSNNDKKDQAVVESGLTTAIPADELDKYQMDVPDSSVEFAESSGACCDGFWVRQHGEVGQTLLADVNLPDVLNIKGRDVQIQLVDGRVRTGILQTDEERPEDLILVNGSDGFAIDGPRQISLDTQFMKLTVTNDNDKVLYFKRMNDEQVANLLKSAQIGKALDAPAPPVALPVAQDKLVNAK